MWPDAPPPSHEIEHLTDGDSSPSSLAQVDPVGGKLLRAA